MQDERLRRFAREQTIFGRELFLAETSEQNYARAAASQVQGDLLGSIAHPIEQGPAAPDWRVEILRVADSLRADFDNPIHYGDNSPGQFTSRGAPIYPDPRFTYFDMWQFGVTGPDGYPGFLRSCGLPASTPHYFVVAAVGLLLVDEAIQLLDAASDSRATSALCFAAECAETARALRWGTLDSEARKRAIEDFIAGRNRLAGVASGEARRHIARAPKERVIQAYKALLATKEHSDAEIKKMLATRFNVKVDTIRLILRKELSDR